MRRRFTKLAVFLLLGAIVNVAVAWGCMLWLPQDNIVTLFEKEVRQRIPPDVYVRSDLFFFNGLEIKPPGRSLLLLGALEVDDGVDSAVPLYWEMHAGWPTMSLDGTYKMTETGTHYPFLFYLPEWLWERVEWFIVPWRPQWPGFAINTVFYAAILWLPFAPFAARRVIRRAIRRRRGHCINCGYDLRGTEHEVCPECGVKREPMPEAE